MRGVWIPTFWSCKEVKTGTQRIAKKCSTMFSSFSLGKEHLGKNNNSQVLLVLCKNYDFEAQFLENVALSRRLTESRIHPDSQEIF